MIYLVASAVAFTFIALKIRDNSKKIKKLQKNMNKDTKEELEKLNEE
jgi:hypothetical protein